MTRMLCTILRFTAAVSCLVIASGSAANAEKRGVKPELESMRPIVLSQSNDHLIPRNLLKLLHAPEVQQELGLSAEKVTQMEDELFAKADGPWFRARSLASVEAEHKQLQRVERLVHSWLVKNFDAEQKQRLLQLEYQSQNLRAFLRKDVAKRLELSADQVSRYEELAKASYDALRTFTRAQYSSSGPTEAQRSAVVAASEAEQKGFKEIFKPEQIQNFIAMAGELFDIASLKRVHPMAPEFKSVKHWINSSPIKLRDLRGKVVLVHFYASECYNCHNNFPIYREWEDELAKKGVVLIGIQTPEISVEADPAHVRAEAKAKNLDHPILIDLDNENWNAYGNTMWPCVYVIDQNGYLRKFQMGELRWKGATYDQDIEKLVDELLAEGSSS
ncbi:MAG TPA: hypothetical protein DDW52_20825 [Planctomycetaceae bacterium]|nr:hypothetical protein [Planctomycetaceae bacterium]